MVNRFGFSLGNVLSAMLVLFGVLLFFGDLPPTWHKLVALLIWYVLLLGFIAGCEIRLIVFYNTKKQVAGEKPEGLPKWALVTSLGLQLAGLVGVVVYIAVRGLL
jgi:hypothetical protein